MDIRESILPLTVGLLFALAAHLAGAAGLGAVRRADLTAGRARPLAPQPDLLLTAMSVSEPRVPGRAVTLTATVLNAGKLPVDRFAVALSVDDAPLAELTMDTPLPPGQSAQHTFHYTARSPGIHQLRLTADPANRIAESREDNNAAEQTLLWRDPTRSLADAHRPDLSVYALDVSTPRIVGDPSRVTVGIANLGGDLKAPFELDVLLDGKRIDRVTIDNPLPAGSLTSLTRNITVDKVGEHEVRAVADPLKSLDDTDRANNALARRFTWLHPADDELKIGQKDPSPVKINWISYDDFTELQARKSRFDQAALQKSVHPDPLATAMPLDPTPPGRNTPAVKPQPSPQPMTRPVEALEQQRMVARIEPDPKPAVTTTKAPQPAPAPSEAPPLPQTPAKLAAAPAQASRPAVPTPINPAGKTLQPRPLIDNTPAPKPVTAPPPTAAPSREVALLTPPLPTSPATRPPLPEPMKRTELQDRAQKRAPQLKPSPDSNLDNATRRVDAPASNQLPALAVLPVRPQLADPAGSPQKDKPLLPADRKQHAPQKPVDPLRKPADGHQPKPTDTPQLSPTTTPVPTPPTPQVVTPSAAKPTLAPKTQRESPPVSVIQGLVVRPGRVLAQHGLQINTVQARFSTVAMLSSAPINPDAVITFNKAGEVTKAYLLKSTGYLNIDGPLLTSFYKWTAQGELLQKVPATLTIQVHILLTPE